MFDRVDQAGGRQTGIRKLNRSNKAFHSKEAQQDFEKVVKETEAVRAPLATAVAEACRRSLTS